MDRVIPIKQERPDIGGTDFDMYDTPANPNQDALSMRGVILQNDTSVDNLVVVSRDVNDNLTLTDPNVGVVKLSELIAGGGTPLYDFLLETDPNYTGFTYSLTYSSGLVSQEQWKITATLKTLKTSNYTYTSGKVNTEIDKIYASDGITVVAQTTTTFSYSGGKISGYVRTRDI